MNLAKLAKLEDRVVDAARAYLKKEGFVEIFTPRIGAATGACENTDTLFEVSVGGDFYWFEDEKDEKKKAYLSQTAQLYLETLVPKIGKVFAVGRSFRAEPEVDHRHLIEFTMVEIEFPGDFEALMRYIEGVINAVRSAVMTSGKEIGVADEVLNQLSCCPEVFPKITYDDAITLLGNEGVEISWGDDIKAAHEQILVEHFDSQPIFITHYPDPKWDHGYTIEVEKFFNMKPDPENPGRVLSCDLILPSAGEAVGAAERVYEYDVLLERLLASNMLKQLEVKGGGVRDFSWYLDEMKGNGIPHSGCGFGTSRINQWITRESIQKSTVFYSQRNILR